MITVEVTGGQIRKPPPTASPSSRDRPDAGRGGEAFDDLTACENGAGAEESDSRDDLGRDPRRIEDDILLVQNAGKTVLGNDHDQAGSRLGNSSMWVRISIRPQRRLPRSNPMRLPSAAAK